MLNICATRATRATQALKALIYLRFRGGAQGGAQPKKQRFSATLWRGWRGWRGWRSTR